MNTTTSSTDYLHIYHTYVTDDNMWKSMNKSRVIQLLREVRHYFSKEMIDLKKDHGQRIAKIDERIKEIQRA